MPTWTPSSTSDSDDWYPLANINDNRMCRGRTFVLCLRILRLRNSTLRCGRIAPEVEVPRPASGLRCWSALSRRGSFCFAETVNPAAQAAIPYPNSDRSRARAAGRWLHGWLGPERHLPTPGQSLLAATATPSEHDRGVRCKSAARDD